MLQYDFETSIGYWIFSTAHDLSRALNEELSSHGITYRQWEVLAWLAYLQAEPTVSELAEQMGIEAPTLVGVVDRMERDGWLQRMVDSEDGRKRRIRVTEQVQPVWDKMVACALRVRQRAIVGIDEDEIRQVRETLAKMRANLDGDGGCP